MYQVSDSYKQNILQNDRNFESEIAIGDKVITNEQLISLNINNTIQQDDTFSIGNAIASTLNLTFLTNDIVISDMDKIDVKIGLLVNEQYEYIPMGVFNIDKIEETDTLTTIIAYDNMIKFDIDYIENNENPTAHGIIGRLEELTGVEFGGTLSDYTNYNLDVLTGYSCRVMLGFIAALFGCNAIMDRQGKFKFIGIANEVINQVNIVDLYTKDSKQLITRTSESVTVKINNNYNSDVYFSYTKKNKNYKLTRIINETDVEELTIGNDEGMCLYMTNPLINQDILTDLYNELTNIDYAPFSMNWQGDMSIDLGDKIAVVDTKGIVREHPVLGINFNYNGGLNSTLYAQGETSITNTYKPPTTQQEQEIIATKKKVVKIEKDAGELYVVVYDSENNSSIRLTEKLLEAIASEIVLQADNIKLEGLTTINDKFKVNTDGTIEAEDAKFSGIIKGSTIEGGTIQINNDKDEVIFKASKEGIEANFKNAKIDGEDIDTIIDTKIEANADEVLVEAKKIELNGSININSGLFTVNDKGVMTVGNISQDGTTRSFVVKNNGNIKIGGTTGRQNTDGTDQGIFEVTSTGTLHSRNKDNADIYSKLEDGKLIVKNEDTQINIASDGIQIKNTETGNTLKMNDNGITTDLLNVSGRAVVQTGLSSTGYVRAMSMAVNNKKFDKDVKTINGSNQSVLYLGHALIVYGRASFTGLTANTTATSSITFDEVFSNPPVVMTTVNSSSPHQSKTGAGSVTTTGCNIYLNRTNTTDTNVFWVAIGGRGTSESYAT